MTSFESMPSHWDLRSLESLCSEPPQNGIFVKGPKFGDGVCFANVKDIYRDVVLNLAEVERLKCDEELVQRYSLRNGDLLFVRSSLKKEGIGRCCLVARVTEPAIFDCHLIRVSPKFSMVDPLFWAYFFLSERGHSDLVARSKTTTMTTINQGSLMQSLVVLPPLIEQHAIANALRTLQEAREARQRELTLERERKAAIMQYLFTHGTRGERRKQTEIGEIPESWLVTTLGNLCANGNGIIQTGPFGSQLHASDYRQSGVPVVNPTHLRANTIDEDKVPLISEENADKLSKHYLKQGDILMSRRGDFSKYAYVDSEHSGWLCGTGCLLVRIQNPLADNYYVSIWFGTELVQGYLLKYSVGMIMPNLNTKILQSVPIAIPSRKEQSEISSAILAVDSKIRALESEGALLDELFKSMLEKFMAGRLSALPLIQTEVAA